MRVGRRVDDVVVTRGMALAMPLALSAEQQPELLPLAVRSRSRAAGRWRGGRRRGGKTIAGRSSRR